MKQAPKVSIGTAVTGNETHSLRPDLQELIRRVRCVPNERILRLPNVKAKTGHANSTIWKSVKDGTLPPPIRIGSRSVGWKESEIDAWIEARALSSRTKDPVDMRAFVSMLVASNSSQVCRKVGGAV